MTGTITFGRALRTWSLSGFTTTETFHDAGLRLPLHDHAAPNVTIVLRGGFDERIEQRSFAALRGSVLVKPAGARHANAYGNRDVECLTIEVPLETPLPEPRHFRAPAFALLAERLRTELAAPDACSSIAAEALMNELVCATQRMARRRDRDAAWLGRIEALIRDGRPPSLVAIAAEVDRHPAHVAREFRAHFGCSIGDYARATRIDRACEALRRSDRSLADIALDAGFYDQSHFTNVFRRYAGTTPERYRTQLSSRTRVARGGNNRLS